jgi:hypothetical protein
MIVRTTKYVQPKPRLSIWLDIGTREGAETLVDVRMLRDAFTERGWTEHMDFKYTEVEGAIHDETAWAARSRPMLEFLFPNNGLAL